MSHFKFNTCLIFILVFMLTHLAQADESSEAPSELAPKELIKIKIKNKVKKFSFSSNTLILNYLSWGEKVLLSNSGQSLLSHASFLGYELVFEHQHYFQPRWGYGLRGSYLAGFASVGGTQTALTYQQSNVQWWGAEASGRIAYRFAKMAIVSAGPNVLYRQISLAKDATGTQATSGASLNFGGTVDLRMRLSEHLEVREEIGLLAVNADTLWAVGLGYTF